MEEIEITGTGISGLTAAINLAKRGYNVKIHEIRSKEENVGNFQGLENWTESENILEILKKINIKTGFWKKEFNKVEIYSPNLKRSMAKSKSPFFYLVERGGKNSIERNLLKQAKDLGVDIIYNSRKSGNIIATGVKSPQATARGITFETNLEDRAMALLDNQIAPKGYVYFLVVNEKATLATVSFLPNKNLNKLIKLAVKKFKKICEFKVKNKQNFAGGGRFVIPNTAMKDGILYTGEASGFQDNLFGFGMKYAFLSGYLAAKSITEDKNYDILWKGKFLDEMKSTKNARKVYEMLSNKDYERIVEKIKTIDKPKLYLRKLYTDFSLFEVFKFFLKSKILGL